MEEIERKLLKFKEDCLKQAGQDADNLQLNIKEKIDAQVAEELKQYNEKQEIKFERELKKLEKDYYARRFALETDIKQKLLQKDNYNYYYTPNDYYEFSSKEHYFEVNIYTDYISYTVTQDSDNITYVDSSKNGDCITFIFKISENTSSNKIESHILFNGNIITTIVQNEDSVDSVDFYATQYTAILKGANSDNSTDNVLVTSTNFNNVEITSVPDNLKCELKPVIPFKINRNKRQIVITNSKNINSKNYIMFNYVDKDNISHPILRSILFKVIVKKLRKIKKPMVTIPNNQIKKPVITIPKNPNISI